MKPRGGAPGNGALWLLTLTWASVGFSIYFALGVVAEHGLGLTPVIFLVAGLLFVLTMFTYIEGSAMLRQRGGSSAFARHAFNETTAFVAGWMILLDLLIVIALAVLSVSHYLEPLTGDLDGTAWGAAIIFAVVLYVAGMNVIDLPARRRPRFLFVLAGADLLVQLLVLVVGLLVVFDPEGLTDSIDLWTSPGVEDAIYAAVLAMLAYAGIEAVANLIPDLDLDPARFGKVVTRTVWLVPVIYAGIAAIALMALPVLPGPGRTGDRARHDLSRRAGSRRRIGLRSGMAGRRDEMARRRGRFADPDLGRQHGDARCVAPRLLARGKPSDTELAGPAGGAGTRHRSRRS